MKIDRKYIIVTLYIVLLVITLSFAKALLSVKSEHGIRQARDMYIQPKNSIDVVFMGSSHVHCDVNTALLWEKYGIAGYNYSGAEQPLWMTYYYLKEICKYQAPKLIVLDLYSPARFKDDYQYNWFTDNTQGMRFSLNKLEMIWNSSEPQHFLRYMFEFASYHKRYKDLSKEDWDYVFSDKKELASFKGYTPYYKVEAQEEPELSENKSGGITLKSEIYLQKIIEFTEKNNIELYLVVLPYVTTDEDELTYNRVKEIAESHGLEFNSTNYSYEKMQLNFEEDFNDNSHLNYIGSCKFTEYFGNDIKSKYDIPDRRGQEKWESWDRHVVEINKAAKEAGY